jgi:hypothetical protein
LESISGTLSILEAYYQELRTVNAESKLLSIPGVRPFFTVRISNQRPPAERGPGPFEGPSPYPQPVVVDFFTINFYQLIDILENTSNLIPKVLFLFCDQGIRIGFTPSTAVGFTCY